MSFKKTGLVIGPVLYGLAELMLVPDFAGDGSTHVLALMAWMVCWWVTEAVPLAVTALLPLVFYPLLGVMKMDQATLSYSNPVIFLFMGGFMIALAMEKVALHKRIALQIMRITGTNPSGIVLGFLIASALLSMWISNTATAVMMLPIAISVTNMFVTDETPLGNPRLNVPLMLSIAYGANIGGTMTLIGTPPNIVMAGILERMMDYRITFSEYFIIGFPTGIAILTCTFFLLILIFKPGRKANPVVGYLIQKEINDLGKFSVSEKLVTVIFGITATLWITQDLINGMVEFRFLNDTNIALIGGLFAFIIPFDIKHFKPVLTWEDTARLPWGILLLFGGGLCMAGGMEKSGIVEIITNSFAGQSETMKFEVALGLIAIVLLLTEIMSNVALITVMLPPIIGIVSGMNINEFSVIIPATIASSMAFSMPISTPPNAIVFASGHLKMKDMLRAGLLLNLVSILILSVLFMILK